jgi:hypothetical protein
MQTGMAEIGPGGIVDNKGMFDASNLYETTWHEGQHVNDAIAHEYKPMGGGYASLRKGIRHNLIYTAELKHQYFNYWSDDVTSKALEFEWFFSKYRQIMWDMGY